MSRPAPSGEDRTAERHGVDGPLFDDTDPGADLTWGVGAVSRRLDVTASTLRTWERRYGVGPSFRTQGGHRRYTEGDIDRVELMRRLVGRGVSAQDAARVSRSLDRDKLDVALTDEMNRQSAQPSPEEIVDAMLAAVGTGDLERLSQIVSGLLRQGRLTNSWRDVLSPALVRMACERSTGALSPEAEQAATAVVVAELRARVIVERLPDTGRTGVLVARNVPAAEAMPLFALKAALSQAGVLTRAVGPEAGPALVASMVSELRPDVLLTWGHPPEPALRRVIDKVAETSIVRALAAWPHELSLRFGFDAPLVSTDVGGAVDLLLDRVK